MKSKAFLTELENIRLGWKKNPKTCRIPIMNTQDFTRD